MAAMAVRLISSSSSPSKVTEIRASAPLKYAAMSSGVSGSLSSESTPVVSLPKVAEVTPSICSICAASSSAIS